MWIQSPLFPPGNKSDQYLIIQVIISTSSFAVMTLTPFRCYVRRKNCKQLFQRSVALILFEDRGAQGCYPGYWSVRSANNKTYIDIPNWESCLKLVTAWFTWRWYHCHCYYPLWTLKRTPEWPSSLPRQGVLIPASKAMRLLIVSTKHLFVLTIASLLSFWLIIACDHCHWQPLTRSSSNTQYHSSLVHRKVPVTDLFREAVRTIVEAL